MKVVLNTDAAVRGVHRSTETPKRGRAAIAFVITDESGAVLKRGGLALDETASVTEAEYSGLIAGLYNAHTLGATEVQVYMDSQLIVNQVNRKWQTKEARLREYRDEAIRLKRELFDRVTITWVSRDFNSVADGLANEILDAS